MSTTSSRSEPLTGSPRSLEPRPFAAAHSGVCSTCEEPFSAGDLIQRAPDGWEHAGCPEEKPFGEMCGACFTAKELSGACLC